MNQNLYQTQKEKQKENWYKKLQFYVVYPNSFDDLYGLIDKLEYIHNLGCNAIHILPLFKSSGIDAGFDVSDYTQIEEKYGGNEAFSQLLQQAKIYNIEIFIDLVLNHISVEHEWFKKAIDGNKKYQNYFITQSKKPTLLEKTNSSATYILEKSEKPTTHKIIFPDFAGEIPHFVEYNNIWYYHTFYPQQIDLNWFNPDVQEEMSNIIRYWGKQGVHFRLDAIPFVAKDIQNNCEVTEQTWYILEELHKVAESVGAVFLCEATKSNQEILPYFGTEKNIRSELAYNFELMNALWLTILDGTYHAFEILKSYGAPKPKHAEWITFLRSHDELMLKSSDTQLNKHLMNLLEKKGLPFKKGRAVAGRLASFLDTDNRKIILAHTLLASLPGNPSIYYGDELGMKNNFEHMLKIQNQKLQKLKTQQENQKNINLEIDPRDCQRAPITNEDIKQGKQIYNEISLIFRERQKLQNIMHTIPTISYKESLLKIEYKVNQEELKIILNFDGEKILDTTEEFPHNNSQIIYMSENIELGAQEILCKPFTSLWVHTQ
jgi:maltose alpha-D-glucosyltransferase / alpha-amylase